MSSNVGDVGEQNAMGQVVGFERMLESDAPWPVDGPSRRAMPHVGLLDNHRGIEHEQR